MDEQFAREVIEGVPIGLVLVHFEDGQYVLFNRAYSQIIGYSLSEACEKDYWDLTPKKYKNAEAALLEALDDPENGRYGPYYKQYINPSRGLIPVCLQLVRLDFKRKFIWSAVDEFGEIPNFCDGADEPIQSTTFEPPPRIPKEVKAMKLFEEAPVGLVVADCEGQIVEANKQFRRLIGRNSVKGLTHKQITPRKYAGSIDRIHAELRERGFTRPYVKQYITQSRGLVPVTVRATRIEYDGRCLVICAVDDLAQTITEGLDNADEAFGPDERD